MSCELRVASCEFRKRFKRNFYFFSATRNSPGVALLQALIMVNIIALTAAALTVLVLGGFMGVANVEQSLDNRAAADAAIVMAYQDLDCFDPEVDGDFAPFSGTAPCVAAQCSAESCAIADSNACCCGDTAVAGTEGTDSYPKVCSYDVGTGIVEVTIGYDAANLTYSINADASIQ